MYLYLGLGLIVSGVLTISVQGITHIVPPQLGFIGLIAIACIPIGFFTFIPMRGLLSHSAEQLQAGVISAEEDVLLKRSIVRRDADGDPFTSYYYSVGALEFEVRKKVYEALPNGTRCRLCSLPPDPTLSASPRERRDAPQKFQPGRYEEIIEQRRQGMKNDFLSLELLEPPR